MTIFVDNNSNFRSHLLSEVGVVKQYLDDLKDLAAGRYPRDVELDSAQVVEHWRRGLVPADAIVGIWTGFELVGEQVFRPLQILSTTGGWARTEAGLLRLRDGR